MENKIRKMYKMPRKDKGKWEKFVDKSVFKKKSERDRDINAMKRNRPLPTGVCSFCGRYYFHKYEGLLPTVMVVCTKCMERAVDIQPIRIMESIWRYLGFYCDKCMGKSYKSHTINPFVCQKCASKIGRLHRTEWPEKEKLQAREKKKFEEKLR